MSIITTDYGLIKPPPGCQLDFGHPISRGLVGCWLFNEKSGTRLTDYSGNGNHGTLENFAMNGATSNWVGSPQGGALNFEGTNDIVTMTDSVKFNPPLYVSISAWIFPTIVTGTRWIFDRVANGAPYYGYIFGINASKLLVNAAYNANSVNGTSTSNIIANVWSHVAFTYDGANIRVYINGILDKTTAATGALTYTSTNNPSIGSRFNNLSGWFNGIIDQVKLYGRVLSSSEISQLYSQPNIGIQSPTYYTPS